MKELITWTAQRHAMWEQLSIPAFAAMHAWLLTTQRSVAAGSCTAKTIEHGRLLCAADIGLVARFYADTIVKKVGQAPELLTRASFCLSLIDRT